jgi:predicted enzyme related to lactoylglutathione lyase
MINYIAPRSARRSRSSGCRLAVDGIDARVKKAVAAGAKVMCGPFDVPAIGRIARLQEPGGAGIGWMTPVNS